MHCMNEKQQAFVKKRLVLGDVIIAESDTSVPCLLVERKTVIDFVQSAYDGRLYDQLNRIQIDAASEKWLLIEGSVDSALMSMAVHQNVTTQSTRAFYISLLSRVLTSYDQIHVMQMCGITDTQYFIVKKLRHCCEPPKDMRIQWRPNKKKRYDIGYMAFLLSFPGMGSKRCRAVVQRFPTLQSLALTTEDELATVISRKAAGMIICAFTRPAEAEVK